METPEYIEQFKAEALAGKSPLTQKGYAHALKKFAEWLEGTGGNLAEFSRYDVQLYIQYLETVAKREPTGINRDFAAIKALARWQGRGEVVQDVRKVKAPSITEKAPEWLDDKTVRKIVAETSRKASKRDYAIVLTLLGCGLRVSELVALDRDDVTISDRKGSLVVRNGKGGKSRLVPIPANVRHALSSYLDQRNDSQQALFLSNFHKRISVRSVQAMLAQYGVHPHQLRHTYVKRLVDAGTPMATIMSLTGHSSADMVAWYSAPTEEEKQATVENIF